MGRCECHPLSLWLDLHCTQEAVLELLVILLFSFVNGIFALSEIALVSVKRQRLVLLAEKGNKRAETVLKLLDKPENFLSAVQIGITLIGIVAGVYGGATLTDNLYPLLEEIELLRPYAENVAYVLVVMLITYLTVVIGELIPKTLAIKYAEPVALAIGPFITLFSLLISPFVWLLSASTRLIFWLLGIKSKVEDIITEEDLRHAIKTAGKQGLFDKYESLIQQKVLSFGDLRAKVLMTHRLLVEWVNVNLPPDVIEQQLRNSHRNHFPACDGTYDKVLGYLHARDFFAMIKEPDFKVRNIIREPVYIPENQYAIDALRQFRKSRCYFGIVNDEFGAFQGIITLHDVLEALVGDLPEVEEPQGIVQRQDGSILASGSLLISSLNEFLQKDLIAVANPFYSTLAGFIFYKLETIPETGDRLDYKGYRFEVVDMDGLRIDKLIIYPIAPN
jgi:putative hemolysin